LYVTDNLGFRIAYDRSVMLLITNLTI
jgi:hypothetical protein